MKIELFYFQSPLERQLLEELLAEIGESTDLGHCPDLDWQHTVVPQLRNLGWRVYFWAKPDQAPRMINMNTGQRYYPCGLIFGRYCPRLLHWRMINE